MARIIHIGDLHLGPNSRNEDRRNALDQILREAPRPISAWVFPGDLNHGRMTIDDRNWLASRLRQMGDEAPVLICYGNHDLPGDLDVFALLSTVWPIRVIAKPQTVCFATPTKDLLAVFVLPYPTRAGLVSHGVPSDQIVDTARQALDGIFMQAAAELGDAAQSGHIPLMIGHVNVAGSIVSSGQPNIGTEIELDPTLIQRLGDVYVGLNHIHKGQYIGGACYPGSCCRLDWGEIDPKRYLVIEYEPDWEGRSWLYRFEPKPLAIAPMYHIEGTLTRDGFDWTCDDSGEAEQAGPGFFAGAEVRVRYRFNADEKVALDDAIVRAPFVGAKRLELDPIAVRSRASRAPEVAAATTLDAKLAAFATRAGVAWDESLDAKLSALQNPDGAAFLSSIYNELSGADTGVVSAATGSSVTSAEAGSHATVSAEPAPGNELSGALL